MRSREEVVRLMGAKDREIDDIQETEDGTVVTVRGTRTLIREDDSMVHGVAEPEVEIVGEVSEEDAERIATHLNGEVTGDGSGRSLPPVDPENPEKERVDLGDSTVAEVLAWVDDDAERAAMAIEAEEARDAPRSTLLTALRKLVG